MLNNPVTVERVIGGRTLTIETNRIAKQAAGSVLVRYGDTVVLTAVTMGRDRSDAGFFPLSCDYREKTYAAGRFPGGFFKREGRPTTKEILTSRLCDRPHRPLFPKSFMREVAVNGYADDYSGVRISAHGRRFTIEQATVRNVVDKDGNNFGQAATFAQWTPLSD